MRHMKTLLLAGVLAGALSAIAATGALAAPHFVASRPGTLVGTNVSTQVFVSGAGQIRCTKATTSGTVTAPLEKTAQEVTVQYDGCTRMGFETIKVTPLHLLVNANGAVTVLEAGSMSSIAGGCQAAIPKQTVSLLSFKNKSGKIEASANVSGIRTIGSGGFCGGSDTNGTLTGVNLVELVGGSIEFVPN